MTQRLDSWLALTEEDPIESGMPILDPHHHFWERPGDVYLLDNLLADTHSGHRVNQTVFVECHSQYRTDGPEEMRSVGEVEFVEGIAAANTAAGGETAVAAAIVGNADLMLGDAVEPVLEALAEAGKGRFRGIRCTAAWDASPDITTARANSAGMLADASFRRGLACLERLGMSFDCIVYHPQLPEVADMARAFPNLTIILNHVGRPLGIGPYAGRREELMPEWRRGIDAVAECPNVVVKVGGLGNPISGFDWHQRPFPAGFRGTRHRCCALLPVLHREVRRRPLHVREQLPGGQAVVFLQSMLERFQAPSQRLFRDGAGRPVPQHGGARLPVAGGLGERGKDKRNGGNDWARTSDLALMKRPLCR